MELHTLTSDAWFSDGVAYPKLPWLSAELLPKLLRWATESKSSEFKSTLSLLPLEKYSLTYQQLKEKYKAMVKVNSGGELFKAERMDMTMCQGLVFIVITECRYVLILYRFGLR